MSAARIIRHQRTDRCNWATEMQLQRRNVEIAHKEGETKFILYDREEDKFIEWVTQFKHLSNILGEMDSEGPAVHRNIRKTRKVWRRLGNLLVQEGADSRVSALLYRAVIQAVLMFGSEYWVLSDATMQVM